MCVCVCVCVCVCRSCGNKEKTINHIINTSSYLAQIEYKTRHDRVGNVIHVELCKKFNFDHSNKWYTYNPESALENETHKILMDFEIQTGHLIPAGWQAWLIVKERGNLPSSGLSRFSWSQSKTKRKRKEM